MGISFTSVPGRAFESRLCSVTLGRFLALSEFQAHIHFCFFFKQKFY